MYETSELGKCLTLSGVHGCPDANSTSRPHVPRCDIGVADTRTSMCERLKPAEDRIGPETASIALQNRSGKLFVYGAEITARLQRSCLEDEHATIL